MYARQTKVPINQTRGEIERLLEKYGASQFVVGSSKETAMIAFEMQGWRIRFLLPLPVAKSAQKEREVAQEVRRRWRALGLVIKAKLEAVESKIVEFEREFMPFIVTNNGPNSTVGDQILGQQGGLARLVSTGKLTPLLGPGELPAPKGSTP